MENRKIHNRFKVCNIIILLFMAIAIIFFFCVPVIYTKEVSIITLKLKIYLVDFLNAKKISFKTSAILMLVGYSIIILNAIANLGHDKIYIRKHFFEIGNFLAVVGSLISLICGFYLIFSFKYTHIALLTIILLFFLISFQTIIFLKCKPLRNIFTKNKFILKDEGLVDDVSEVANKDSKFIDNKKAKSQKILIITLFIVLVTSVGCMFFVIF